VRLALTLARTLPRSKVTAVALAAACVALPAVAPGRAGASDPVIAAAGDIACDPAISGFNNGAGTLTRCRQKYTSDLLVNAGLAAVLPLGDVQYECSGYDAFAASYGATWGRLLSISRPVTGNHEYLTTGGTGCDATNAGAAGYFKYFGATAGDPAQGYYSYDIDAWHLIALNSQCQQGGGCKDDTPQGKWLKDDLAAHPNQCTLAYMHVPRFSSGGHAKAIVQPLWDLLYAAGADVVLSGHDHIYERFAPMTPSGELDLAHGIRQFVVGTGGATHTAFVTSAPNSEIRDANTFGVLEMTLYPDHYAWQFVPEPGQAFTDAGSQNCHSAQSSSPDTTAPSIPASLSAKQVSGNEVELSWSASTDEVGVAGYNVYRNGTQIGTSPTTSYSDTTVQPNTTYEYTVAAYDAANNTSDQSAPVSYTGPPASGQPTPAPVAPSTAAPVTQSTPAPVEQSPPAPVLPPPADTTDPKTDVTSSSLAMDPRGYVAIKVKCPSTEPAGCTGTLTLRTASRVVISAKKRFVTLGGATFRAGGGRTVKVNVKLSSKSRKLVTRLKRFKVKVTAVARDQGNHVGTTTKTLTLKNLRYVGR
jgi:acid phosphatase type 7